MQSFATLDAPTLIIANLIMSASTVGLLLITRFGLGEMGHRMSGWIAGEALLLVSRAGYPLVWVLASHGVDLRLEKLVPPLVVTGLCWHVVGLRQARTGAPGLNWRGMAISVALVLAAYLLSQPLPDTLRHKSFVASIALVWLAMLREAWPMRHRSWGGRGLVLVSAVVALSNIMLVLKMHPEPGSMQYAPGLLIETVVVLVTTSCYMLWLQEDVRRHLTDMAQTDALTGLLNRHGVLPRLEAVLAAGRPVSLVLCDLDHFKRVNDTHGHAVGDEVLRRFARRALQVTRSSDFVARWGGEEFLVMLPDTDSASARAMAERLRAVCREPEREGAAATALPVVTFSAGVAGSLEAGGAWTVDPLLARADARLYRAKERRDCVVAVDSEPAAVAAPRAAAERIAEPV
jgi:diguanylate cyclase (GGDEF)-like protein